MKIFKFLIGLSVSISALFAQAKGLKVGDPAPLFKTQKHDGSDFDLSSRKGAWTVLFFYPKAGTPGCTTQACAFRDNILKIREQGAEVFGISADSLKDQAEFHKKHRLAFDLLIDPNDQVLKAYGTKIFGLNFSKRWTFIVDPDLRIRSIDKDVDPAMDAQKVADKIKDLKSQTVK